MTAPQNLKERLIIALDVSSIEEAKQLCNQLIGQVTFFKIGLELFTGFGRAAVDMVHELGGSVFLDLKLHDIPNQVGRTCRKIAELGVEMLSIHTLGGRQMMEIANTSLEEAAADLGIKKPLVVGVTVLTSLSEQDFELLGFRDPLQIEVSKLADLAKVSGLDGVVASPQETEALRSRFGEDFLLVTPGIRGTNAEYGDQKRAMSAKEAIDAGASYLVIGRPVTQAPNPSKALTEILTILQES